MKPKHHEQDMILCQVIEPATPVTGVKFYLCTRDGCGKIADEEGRMLEESP